LAHSTSRRTLLVAGLGAASELAVSAFQSTVAFGIGKPISAGEDLMQEHGVLGRLLLIYEELARRFEKGDADPSDCLLQSTSIIVDYIQGHHERVEELMIFPALRKAGVLPELVAVLVSQHEAGRTVIDAITKRVHDGAIKANDGRLESASLMRMFLHMYRPHALREDTVVFPTLHRTLSESQYQELSTRIQTLEKAMVHNDDLIDIVKRLDQIEIALGIHDLASFTAKVPPGIM
jgi:hemerythrin-like domain-containing protein